TAPPLSAPTSWRPTWHVSSAAELERHTPGDEALAEQREHRTYRSCPKPDSAPVGWPTARGAPLAYTENRPGRGTHDREQGHVSGRDGEGDRAGEHGCGLPGAARGERGER